MTDERLKEIEEDLDLGEFGQMDDSQQEGIAQELVDEVRRLREVNERLDKQLQTSSTLGPLTVVRSGHFVEGKIVWDDDVQIRLPAIGS